MGSQSIKYMGCGHLVPDPAWVMKNHRHPMLHELIVVFRGKITVRIGGRDLTAGRGDILYYPKGVWHEERSCPDDPVETYFIGWHGPTGKWDTLLHDTDGRVHLLVQWLFQENISTFDGVAALKDAHIKSVLAELSKLTIQKGQSSLVREIRTYIQDHLRDPLTLDDLADQAGMSKYHFIRKYRQLSGRTPMEDLRMIRIDAARNLVMTTDLPLKAIAVRVGLCDEFYLCRLSAKYFKASLGSFRRMSYRS
jgi:AraC-like DNA-binding protein/mannose-6-phosphate isomerase-like protein (cupin superfamily)